MVADVAAVAVPVAVPAKPAALVCKPAVRSIAVLALAANQKTESKKRSNHFAFLILSHGIHRRLFKKDAQFWRAQL